MVYRDDGINIWENRPLYNNNYDNIINNNYIKINDNLPINYNDLVAEIQSNERMIDNLTRQLELVESALALSTCEITRLKQHRNFDERLSNIQALLFDEKEKIPDGLYVKLMDLTIGK